MSFFVVLYFFFVARFKAIGGVGSVYFTGVRFINFFCRAHGSSFKSLASTSACAGIDSFFCRFRWVLFHLL